MKSRRNWFNLNLLLAALAALLMWGCQSPESKRKQQLTKLHVYLESINETKDREQIVPISRDRPIAIKIQKAPFLSESYVKKAEVINVMGGFALRITFDRQGSWLLESYSTANRGKHLAIFSSFVEPPGEVMNAGRWLAAPLITQRITNGVLTFTADVSREEAEEIVRGLTNIAEQMERDSKLW